MDEPSGYLARCQLCQALWVLLVVALPSGPGHATMWTEESGEANTAFGGALKVRTKNVALVVTDLLEVRLGVFA